MEVGRGGGGGGGGGILHSHIDTVLQLYGFQICTNGSFMTYVKLCNQDVCVVCGCKNYYVIYYYYYYIVPSPVGKELFPLPFPPTSTHTPTCITNKIGSRSNYLYSLYDYSHLLDPASLSHLSPSSGLVYSCSLFRHYL